MSYADFPTSGHDVRWDTWDGGHHEATRIRWENGGWVVEGTVTRERVQYVLRLNASWRVSQMLLFRDLNDPDLWLGTDGSGRWGEVNGAHRTELDGCFDIALTCTPLTETLPIRRLPLGDGEGAEIDVAVVDVDTLEVRRRRRRYTRQGAHRWTITDLQDGERVVVAVDGFGLLGDVEGRWRRVT